jgi:hypothetical protein
VSELEQKLRAAQHPASSSTEANATARPRPARPSVTIELPHMPRANDRDHWLARCDQFAVYAGDRLLGTVEGIRYQSRADRPDLIEVRGGLFGRRMLVVPVDEVESVLPDEEAILVDEACSGTTSRQRLRARVKQLVATLHPLPR